MNDPNRQEKEGFNLKKVSRFNLIGILINLATYGAVVFAIHPYSFESKAAHGVIIFIVIAITARVIIIFALRKISSH